ncbi:MAG: agmatinase [Waddliaceae bacterium]
MLKGPFCSKNWMGACRSFEDADWVMVGLPYDGTCSYRPGARFGPEAIRVASHGLELYSPDQDKSLEDIQYYDAGDLELPIGNQEKSLRCIEQACRETLSLGKRWFGVGGEHLVTYPAVKAYTEKYEDLCVIHVDAHADLREDYLGEPLSHATVIRRVVERISPVRLIQIGIRSGKKEEFQWMHDNKTLVSDLADVEKVLHRFVGKPIYLTIDLDFFDPNLLPGTGTPEPGGHSYSDLMDILLSIKKLNIVGADVVELSPHYDSSGVSTMVAAKVIREVLLLS